MAEGEKRSFIIRECGGRDGHFAEGHRQYVLFQVRASGALSFANPVAELNNLGEAN